METSPPDLHVLRKPSPYRVKVQDEQELNDPNKVSATWVKHLHELVNELNDTETDMIGIKPSDAIKMD